MQSIYDSYSLEYLCLFVTTGIAATFSGAMDEVFLHYALVVLQLFVYRCICPVQSIEFGMYGFGSLFSKESEPYMPLLYPSNSVVFKKMHFYRDSGFEK